VHVTTHTAYETEEFGRRLAIARPSDARALVVLYLTGDLGAGKTTFARGFLRGLGEVEPVRSPTYTHIDLYRLRDETELDSLGLRDWARPGCLWLIEWPERGGARLPPPDLVFTFTVGVSAHEIDVRSPTALGHQWLRSLER
jgi:tRNA threonylcarbamoyladenosine biosynthesis protein TsaE